jgi:hypothetical protein
MQTIVHTTNGPGRAFRHRPVHFALWKQERERERDRNILQKQSLRRDSGQGRARAGATTAVACFFSADDSESCDVRRRLPFRGRRPTESLDVLVEMVTKSLLVLTVFKIRSAVSLRRLTWNFFFARSVVVDVFIASRTINSPAQV